MEAQGVARRSLGEGAWKVTGPIGRALRGLGWIIPNNSVG